MAKFKRRLRVCSYASNTSASEICNVISSARSKVSQQKIVAFYWFVGLCRTFSLTNFHHYQLTIREQLLERSCTFMTVSPNQGHIFSSLFPPFACLAASSTAVLLSISFRFFRAREEGGNEK